MKGLSHADRDIYRLNMVIALVQVRMRQPVPASGAQGVSGGRRVESATLLVHAGLEDSGLDERLKTAIRHRGPAQKTAIFVIFVNMGVPG